jgi:NAD(P)H-dependent FMN reductase
VARPVVQVIIGSTRPGRVGPAVADWITDRARARGDLEVVVTDLAGLNLPMFDEPNHPRLHQYIHQHTKDWSAIVERSDAFIFVIPEYNYGFNAATKNALDYLNQEWRDKPAGIVSYGAVSGGTRATQMLKQVMSGVRLVPLTDSVNIPFVREKLDEEGRLKPNEIMEQAAAAMLDELARYAEALRPLRYDTVTDTEG